jgi:inorganic triphosphatase YgiF
MGNPDTGTEIELKFQVPADRLPALERALATSTAETVPLKARYYDTPDGRLDRARLAWRLRLEAGRWVQTLKGPGDGLVQRLEHEVPRDPADGEPPAPDPALHAGHPAGQALLRALKGAQPVMRHGTEITRLRRVIRHGGARIELALDRGDVVAGGARAPVAELEFELLSGPMPALLDLAARWAGRFGLRPDPATKSERAQWLLQGLPMRPPARGDTPQPAAAVPLASARATLLAAALAHALPNAAAITDGRYGPDHLHQLRVGLRRLRSVLRAFGPEDPVRDAALATLFAALGGTRDADVLGQTLAPALADAATAGWPGGLPAPAADGAAPMDVVQALRAPGTTRLWLLLLALTVPAAEPGGDPLPWGPVALNVLRRWHRRARRDAGRWPQLDEASRHALRKRLKRLRYLMEFAGGLWPNKAMKAEAAALRRLQDTLGRWNDLIVARQTLAALPASPVRDFAAGWAAAELRHADAACARDAAAWRALKGSVFRRAAGRRKPR